MKSAWDESARKELLGRLSKLTPDSKPLWGKMDAAQMLGHCNDAMRAAMGDFHLTPKNTPFRNPVLRYLVIYWLPWPKGAPTAVELIREEPEDFSQNSKALAATLEKLAARRSNGLRDHAAFGKMSEKDWGCLTYRHIDHHCKQFGL